MNIYQKWNKNQLIRFRRKWGKEDMTNLQWLKLSTDFFDNNKIKLIESEKDGDTLIRVWIYRFQGGRKGVLFHYRKQSQC